MAKPVLDLMVDIETLSRNRDKGLVLSVGIKSFSTDNVPPVADVEFYVVIDPESSKQAGRTVCQRTLDWWQSPNAKAAYNQLMHEIQQQGVSFQEGWSKVDALLRSLAKTYTLNVWSKGIDFDFAMIESSLRDAGVCPEPESLPYKFYNKMDVRTVLTLAKRQGWRNRTSTGFLSHNALDDCKQQIIQLYDALIYLSNSR